MWVIGLFFSSQSGAVRHIAPRRLRASLAPARGCLRILSEIVQFIKWLRL
jgi:hypothetical protein